MSNCCSFKVLEVGTTANGSGTFTVSQDTPAAGQITVTDDVSGNAFILDLLNQTVQTLCDGDADTCMEYVEGADDVIQWRVDGTVVMELTDSKLTLNGIFIDPATGLELEPQTYAQILALTPNPQNTLYIDSVTGHAFRGTVDLELTLQRNFVPDSALAPASVGSPTIAEIETYALANTLADALLYYNGTDVGGNPATYVWHIDDNGDAVVLNEPVATNSTIPTFAGSTSYVQDEPMWGVSPTTGHTTLYTRIAAGTSGVTFDSGEEALWNEVATFGRTRLFAPDSTVAPALAGNPTEAEISVFALANNFKDGTIFYNGTDVAGNGTTIAYNVDSAGVVTVMGSVSTDLVSDWQASTAYVADEEVTFLSPTTGHQTIYRRIADGTSGVAFNAAEELLWEPISSLGIDNTFASEGGVSPATAGEPTIAEIEAFATTNNIRDGLLYYTGTNVSTDPVIATYWIDASGNAQALGSESDDLLVAWTASTAYKANAEVYATSPTSGHVTLYSRIADGTSGATFDSAEELLWTPVSSWGYDTQFATETLVNPLTAGLPTLAEIEAYAVAQGYQDTLITYNGTNVDGNDYSHIYWVDQSGSATLIAPAGIDHAYWNVLTPTYSEIPNFLEDITIEMSADGSFPAVAGDYLDGQTVKLTLIGIGANTVTRTLNFSDDIEMLNGEFGILTSLEVGGGNTRTFIMSYEGGTWYVTPEKKHYAQTNVPQGAYVGDTWLESSSDCISTRMSDGTSNFWIETGAFGGIIPQKSYLSANLGGVGGTVAVLVATPISGWSTVDLSGSNISHDGTTFTLSSGQYEITADIIGGADGDQAGYGIYDSSPALVGLSGHQSRNTTVEDRVATHLVTIANGNTATFDIRSDLAYNVLDHSNVIIKEL